MDEDKLINHQRKFLLKYLKPYIVTYNYLVYQMKNQDQVLIFEMGYAIYIHDMVKEMFQYNNWYSDKRNSNVRLKKIFR